MRIVLTGGGTGGHVMPFESIIEALRTIHGQKDGDLEIYFLGVTTPEGEDLFQKYDVPAIHIPSGKRRRYFSFKNILDAIYYLPFGISMALWHMWKIMPDAVVSKGGYASVPTCLAAVFYRIPILLHESDVVPGSANMFLARFASAITLGFAVAREYFPQWPTKLFVTGTPIRMFVSGNQKQTAKQSFGLSPDESVLLVMGGSQGSQQINESLLACITDIVQHTAVIHITGQEHYEAITKIAAEFLSDSTYKDRYKPYAHITNQMAMALSAADAALTRAGASSLAEIARLRIPSLIIPLASSAHDHQRKNALAFEAAGGALVLDPSNVSPSLVKQSIIRLMSDTALRATLGKNLETLDFPNAAFDIAKLAIQLASGFRPV